MATAQERKNGATTAQNSKGSTPSAASSSDDRGESVDVDNLKKKYWAVGDETKLGVVQDRYYTKAGKLELGLFGGVYSGDPFLDTRSLGGLVGYHFTEAFGINALAWKDFVNDSEAMQKFVATAGFRTNSNPTQAFYGAEATLSPLYGKLSLFGEVILYFDLHVSAGAGATDTENGAYFTGLLGVGQQIFVAKNAALGFDFRWLAYKEDVVEKVGTQRPVGTLITTQMAYSSLISLGLHIYF